jgi:S-adenosylmethionine synthetase
VVKLSREFFTSESVTEGHPDKVADQVSDAVLDAMLEHDKYARVACETLVTTGLVLVAGEISTRCYVDIPHVVRNTLREIGYTRAKYGFDCETCSVLTAIDEQSQDIAAGVNASLETRSSGKTGELEIGAGDQGMMFGYACDETPEFMPLPISLAHRITRKLAEARKSGEIPYLRPDGKAQVTVEYMDGWPCRVDTVVVSTQHSSEVSSETIRKDIIEKIIRAAVPEQYLAPDTKYFVNPSGRFVVGGPHGDSGVTGRKIIVDTYGGMARHGGGAFSGKDPTKVDRSASYAARHVAKNIVAAGLAKKCELQVSYAIGVAQPVSLFIDTFGTGVVSDSELTELIKSTVDMRPGAIIKRFDLLRPIYTQVASYGHFGRSDLDLPWERLDLADTFKREIRKSAEK